MTVTVNKIVSFHYTLKNASDEELENNSGSRGRVSGHGTVHSLISSCTCAGGGARATVISRMISCGTSWANAGVTIKENSKKSSVLRMIFQP